jgi:hypothetical protein
MVVGPSWSVGGPSLEAGHAEDRTASSALGWGCRRVERTGIRGGAGQMAR